VDTATVILLTTQQRGGIFNFFSIQRRIKFDSVFRYTASDVELKSTCYCTVTYVVIS